MPKGRTLVGVRPFGVLRVSRVLVLARFAFVLVLMVVGQLVA